MNEDSGEDALSVDFGDRTISVSSEEDGAERVQVDQSRDPADINVQIDEIGFGKFQVIAATTFVLFTISDGMELVVTNVAWRDLPRKEWNMEESFRAFFVSTSFAGFLLGAFVGGFIGDLYGRRINLYVHGVIFLPASIFSAKSQDKFSLMAMRFFVGISMGLVLPTCVSLMTEFSPSYFRSRLVVMIPGVAYCLGAAAVLAVGIVLIGNSKQEDCDGSCGWWRGMMVAGVVPDVIALLLTYMYLPESPRFLLFQGKMAEVKAVLHHIATINGVPTDAASRTSSSVARRTRPVLAGMEQPHGLWAAMEHSVRELLSTPVSADVGFIVALWCLLGCSVFGQSFLYPILLEEASSPGSPPLSPVDQFWLLITTTLIEIPGIPVAIYLMEHPDVGLRLALIGFSLCCMCGAAFVCAFIDQGRVWIHVGNLALRLFAILPYEMMYVYAAETLPTSHRNAGVSMGNAATKGVAMVVPLVLLPLLRTEIHIPFVVMGCCAGAAAFLTSCFGAEPPKALQDVAFTPRSRASQRVGVWARASAASGLAVYPGVLYASPREAGSKGGPGRQPGAEGEALLGSEEVREYGAVAGDTGMRGGRAAVG